MPIFGTLIALAVDGFPKVGVIDQPVLNERWCVFTGLVQLLTETRCLLKTSQL